MCGSKGIFTSLESWWCGKKLLSVFLCFCSLLDCASKDITKIVNLCKHCLITGLHLFLNNPLPSGSRVWKIILIGRQWVCWQFRSAFCSFPTALGRTRCSSKSCFPGASKLVILLRMGCQTRDLFLHAFAKITCSQEEIMGWLCCGAESFAYFF